MIITMAVAAAWEMTAIAEAMTVAVAEEMIVMAAEIAVIPAADGIETMQDLWHGTPTVAAMTISEEEMDLYHHRDFPA